MPAIYPMWQDFEIDAESSIDYELIGTEPEPGVRDRVLERQGLRGEPAR